MAEWEAKYQAALEDLKVNPPLRELNGCDLEPMVWYKQQMPCCVCTGGSSDCMYIKKGTGTDLAIFMIGGGVSWCGETARFPGSLKNMFNGQLVFYTDEVQPNNDYCFFRLLKDNGIFSLQSDNRFADWSIAMVNYGTGDFHIGQNDYHYLDENGHDKVLHHQGYVNFMACLEKIKQLFLSPSRLVITGESAGAFSVPVMAGDIMDS